MDRVLKLTVAYDGTAYVGWQRQAEGVSIQGLIEEALTRLDGAPVTVQGAGRTDAGVHAFGQVASARVQTTHDPLVIRRALNAILPGDIRVVGVEDAAPGFHARYDAAGKSLPVPDLAGRRAAAVRRAWSWHLPRPLDVAAMDRAARMLEGRHDFSAFQSAGSGVTSAVRTVTSARAGVREPAVDIAGRDRRRHRRKVRHRPHRGGRLPPAHGARDRGHPRRGGRRAARRGVGGRAAELARPGRVGRHGAGPRPRPGSRDVPHTSSRGLIVRRRAAGRRRRAGR